MKKTVIAAALGALALAAPAYADTTTPLYPETIPGAGLNGVAGASHTIVRQASGSGLVGGVAFRLTPKHVTYGSFRSVKVSSVAYGLNAVKVRGTGLLGGRRVAFTAVGVHNAMPGVDVFRLAWNHGASLGGIVTSGAVFIR
jgi:hypothetical protein